MPIAAEAQPEADPENDREDPANGPQEASEIEVDRLFVDDDPAGLIYFRGKKAFEQVKSAAHDGKRQNPEDGEENPAEIEHVPEPRRETERSEPQSFGINAKAEARQNQQQQCGQDKPFDPASAAMFLLGSDVDNLGVKVGIFQVVHIGQAYTRRSTGQSAWLWCSRACSLAKASFLLISHQKKNSFAGQAYNLQRDVSKALFRNADLRC